MEYQDEDCIQTIDYEHRPFLFRKCHEHGHLFRDYPLNAPTQPPMEEKSKDGFTQVTSHKKQPLKKHSQGTDKKISISNSFDGLNNLSNVEEV